MAKVFKIENHIGRFTFDFYEDQQKLVSAGQDCLLKIYDVSDDNLSMIKQVNCEDACALAIDQATNDLYIAYSENRSVLKVNHEDISSADEIQGQDIASFLGPVFSLSSRNSCLAIASQENTAVLLKMTGKENAQLIRKSLQKQHSGSCLYASVNSDNSMALSVGCDGNLHIYSILNSDSLSDPIFEASLHVTFTMVPEKEYIMECAFISKDRIAIGGNATLQLAEKSESGQWTLSRITEINHKREIQICVWVESEGVLITGGLEGDVKIWDFESKTQLIRLSAEETITNVKYSEKQKALFVGDMEGHLFRWSGQDFKKMKANLAESLVEKQDNHKSGQKQSNNGNTAAVSAASVESASDWRSAVKKIAEQAEQRAAAGLDKGRKRLDLTDDEDEDLGLAQLLQKPITVDPSATQSSSAKKQQANLGNLKGSSEPIKVTPASHTISTPTKQFNNLEISASKKNRQHSTHHSTKRSHYKMQDIVCPSAVSKQLNRECLIWNLAGQVISRQEDDDLLLDIELANKEIHAKITLKNLHNYCLAAINTQAFVLASKPPRSNGDSEDNEAQDNINLIQDAYDHSFLYFSSLDRINPCTWSIKLAKDEIAESLAIGDGWCAVSTDSQYIRIYGFSSMEQHCICLEKPVVCIVGFGNILGCVYLDGEPICGCQALRITFYNADTAEIFKEIGLPITPFSSLVWFGFSEEGLPITKDSKGIVRALVGFNAWTPIYDDSDKSHILWLKGMVDYNLIGFYLGRDELEPRLVGKLNNEKSVPMELLLPQGDFFEGIEEYRQLREKQLILRHEQVGIQKPKSSNNHNYNNSTTNSGHLEKLEKEIDARVLKIFQKCVAQQEYERGFAVVKSNIINPIYIDSCVLIAQKARQKRLENQLHQLQKEKQSKKKGNLSSNSNNLMSFSNSNHRHLLIIQSHEASNSSSGLVKKQPNVLLQDDNQDSDSSEDEGLKQEPKDNKNNNDNQMKQKAQQSSAHKQTHVPEKDVTPNVAQVQTSTHTSSSQAHSSLEETKTHNRLVNPFAKKVDTQPKQAQSIEDLFGGQNHQAGKTSNKKLKH